MANKPNQVEIYSGARFVPKELGTKQSHLHKCACYERYVSGEMPR